MLLVDDIRDANRETGIDFGGDRDDKSELTVWAVVASDKINEDSWASRFEPNCGAIDEGAAALARWFDMD
jgi:hypothetical protein